jgi:HlyD family type I secretion membrane fusion protein
MTAFPSAAALSGVILPPSVRVLPETRIRGLLLGGFLTLGLGLGGMTAWAALAPLHGAVVATGMLSPETGRKTVKHNEGGTIAAVLIHDGDTVKAGAPLIRLDATEAASRAGIVTSDLRNALAQMARLDAERTGRAAILWPDDLTDHADDPDVARQMAIQQALFDVRRAQLAKDVGLIRDRIATLANKAEDLKQQRGFVAQELAILRQELGADQKLYAHGYATQTKVLDSQRDEAQLEENDRELAVQIEDTHNLALEAQGEIDKLEGDRREKILTDLTQTRADIAKQQDQLRDATDKLDARVIRAPDDGIVTGFRHVAPGAVVTPNEALLDIVPAEETLLAEAHVQPRDIKEVVPGLKVKLVLTAYDTRVVGALDGKVDYVSADRLTDTATQQPYYLVKIRLDGGTAHQVHNLRIVPGMPVEARIITGERTALSYITGPLSQSYLKAFIQ